jgi:uncharacterized protein (DUF427 family)
MKLPGPDHPITLEPSRKRMRAAFERHVIADTDDAIVLREADYPPAIYFPMEDVEMGFFAKTDPQTHCPYKGDASYWTIYMDGVFAENAVWAYEAPFPAVAALRGRIAFDPKAVEVYEIDEAGQHCAPILGGTAGRSTP